MVSYPDWLTSDGEAPYYTEWFIVVEEGYRAEHGKTMLETVLGNEMEKYPDRYESMPSKIAEIVERADAVYGDREIGAETEDMFMKMLQKKVARICPKWEHRFSVYDKLTEEQIGDLRETIDGKSETVFQDTPTGQLTGKYATNVTDGTTHTEQTDGTTLNATNKNMERFRILVEDFIEEFEDCFMDTAGLI